MSKSAVAPPPLTHTQIIASYESQRWQAMKTLLAVLALSLCAAGQTPPKVFHHEVTGESISYRAVK